MAIVKRLKKKKRKIDFWILDTETWGFEPTPENLAFGILMNEHFSYVFYNKDEFILLLETKVKKGIIFAHNAEYDLSAIFGNMYQNLDNKSIFNGKFISAEYKKIRFADSFNIYPFAASKIGELLNYEKGVTPEKFIKALRDEPILKSDIEYCYRDCKIIHEGLNEFFHETGRVSLTIGSAAMYYFRTQYMEYDFIYNEKLSDNFFLSYYGGRTEAFTIGAIRTSEQCSVYDINSLYPSSMYNAKFPDISSLKYKENLSVAQFLTLLNRYEGCATIKVKHANTYLGYLPYKGDKLLFPTGIFYTSVNFNEIRYALEKNVIEILEVSNVTYAHGIESPFKEFVGDNFGKRKNSKSEIRKMILKLLLNNLYGKFAMRKKYTNEYFETIPHEFLEELRRKKTYYTVKNFSALRDDCFIEYENVQFEKSYFAIAVFASYITSYSRVKLLDGLVHNQKGLKYCDTDSLFITEEPKNLKIGLELGEYKKEDKNIKHIYGLKNYLYTTSEGEEKRKLKGVNKMGTQVYDSNTIKKEIGKDVIIEKGYDYFLQPRYIKTKEGLRRGIKTGMNTTSLKVIKNNYDKRVICDNGRTKPIILNE